MGGQATVKDIRKSLRMTQSKFAKELGVSRSSIRDWESGKKELSRKSWEKLMEFTQQKLLKSSKKCGKK